MAKYTFSIEIVKSLPENDKLRDGLGRAGAARANVPGPLGG